MAVQTDIFTEIKFGFQSGQNHIADDLNRNLRASAHMAMLTMNPMLPAGSAPPNMSGQLAQRYGYIVPANATGDWHGHANKIAFWNGNSWDLYQPVNGSTVTVMVPGDYGPQVFLEFWGGSWRNAQRTFDKIRIISMGPSSLVGTNEYGEFIPADATIADPFGQELFSYSLAETITAIPRFTGTNDCSGTRAFAFVPTGSVTIRSMRVAIRQAGGSWMRMGIYNASGLLVAGTQRFAPIANAIKTQDLIVPETLIGGRVYYMAYWTDDQTGNLQFPVVSGRSVDTPDPLFQLHDPNEMPPSIATGMSNTQFRPWLMISG